MLNDGEKLREIFSKGRRINFMIYFFHQISLSIYQLNLNFQAIELTVARDMYLDFIISIYIYVVVYLIKCMQRVLSTAFSS